MTDSLRIKAKYGVLWSAVDRFSVQSVQFLIGVVLARLLSPTDYGMIGMLVVFLAISQTFVDGGFSNALIQKNKCSEEDFSSVFFINVFIGLIIYLILFFSSPLIESFFKTPGLAFLTKVLGLNIIISSLAVVQRARLTIDIDFKTQTKASFVSVVIGGIVGLLSAYQGYGVWALVFQSLVITAINTVLLWVIAKWVPTRAFSYRAVKALFSFGSKLLAASLLNTVFKNIYLLVIGKFFSAQSLGYYTRALQFQKLPSENITMVLQRVSFPVLSAVKDEDLKLLPAVVRFIKISTFIISPLMAGLALLAEPIVQLVLTEKWLPVVPMLQLLCLIGVLYPIQSLNINLLLVKGLSGLVFKLEVIKKILITISIIICIPLGVYELIVGQVVISLMALFINTYYTGKIFGYSLKKQILDVVPTFFNTLIMAAAIFFIDINIDIISLKLFVSIFSGMLSYSIIALIVNRAELSEIKGIAKIA